MAKEKIKINWQLTGWIARDECGIDINDMPGFITLYSNKPKRSQNEDFGGYWDSLGDIITLPRNMFPELTWKDEPVYVKLTIEVLQ